MNDLEKFLLACCVEYRDEIKPLHPDDGNGEETEYGPYDSAFTEMQETMFAVVNKHFVDKGLL